MAIRAVYDILGRKPLFYVTIARSEATKQSHMYKYIPFISPDGSTQDPSDAAIIVIPVPYDKTSTWIKGTDKGPSAILSASSALELYDIETEYDVSEKGIFTCPPLKSNISPEELIDIVYKEVKSFIAVDKFAVTLGGEHSVSIGAVKAHNEKTKDMCVLQLDAHADLRDEYEGSRYNHACTAARIKEMCPVVQVGVRSMCSEEKDKFEKEDMFLAREMMNNDKWQDEIVSRLSDDVYITIDLDVLDPSIMPSTGTPEPGGLDWYQILSILKLVAEKKNIVGFDVVELCPQEGSRAPDFLAAKLVYKLLGYVYSK